MPEEPHYTTIAGNSVHDWLLAAAFAGGGWLIGQMVYRMAGAVLRPIAKRSGTRLDDVLVDQLRSPVVLLIIVLGFVAGAQHLTFGERVTLWTERMFHVAVALSVTWIVARVLIAIVDEVIHGRSREHGQFTRALP